MILALGFGLTGFAVGLWQFAATVVIWTLGEMMMAPFNPAIVSDLAPTRLRARYMGVSNMAFATGGMLGPPIGGQILGHPALGGRTLWTGTFLAAMLAAVLYFSVRRRLAVEQD
jgi:MFS family permease